MARPALKPWPEMASHLEPSVSAYHGTDKLGMETYVSLSAAVSAKRQADALERIADALNPATGMTFSDKLEDSLVRGIQNGVDQAISMWQHRR